MPKIDKIRVNNVDYDIGGSGGENEIYIGDEQDAPASTKLLIDEDETDFVNVDTMPIGSEVDYDGDDVPLGWEEVEDKGEVYSTDEIRVGTWIDGKPLYQKTYNLLSYTYQQANTEYKLVPIPSNADLFHCFIVEGHWKTITEANKTMSIPINYYLSSTNYMYAGIYDGYIVSRVGYNSTVNISITIRYTKTTDQGGNA